MTPAHRRASASPLHGRRQEASHRRIEGYATHWSLTDPRQNEATTSRFHQLKYACQESLALSLSASAPSMFIFDTVGVLAAAVSMVFAYLVTMWAQRTFGTQQVGLQLLIVVTVVYVVKDRIKVPPVRHRRVCASCSLPCRICDALSPLASRRSGASGTSLRT